MPPKIEGGHFGLRERVDCEAGPPVDSPSTHLRSPCTHPRSRVSAGKSGVGGGECQVICSFFSPSFQVSAILPTIFARVLARSLFRFSTSNNFSDIFRPERG